MYSGDCSKMSEEQKEILEQQNLPGQDAKQNVQVEKEGSETLPDDTVSNTETAPMKKHRESKWKIKKFDLYIIKNFLGTFAFAILLLCAIVIVFDTNEKLDAVLTAPVSATVFQYFMNFLPFILSQFSPLFTFISVIFFTSRLADRSEIIAMLSSGISFKRLLVPYMVSAFLIASVSYLLSAYIIPPANVKRIEYTNRWVKNKEIVYADNIQLQVKDGVMAFMSRYDNTTRSGYKFSLEKYEGKEVKSRLTAENIRYDSAGLWTLTTWKIQNFNGLKEEMTSGGNLDTLLNIEPRDFLISKNDEQTLTSPELKQYIERQKERGVANIKDFEIEYERRYAMTAAAFILTIIGLSLSSRKVRGGIGVNIGIGLLLSFSYILFMTVTSTFAVNNYTSARVAMWIPNLIYSIIAIYLYRRAAR